MNSYTLIDKLRKARRRHSISVGAQALFHELVAVNNEEGWDEVFKCTSSELFGALGVSEKTLSTYRAELISAGLLGYISGKTKRCPSEYCLFGSSLGSMIGSNIYHPNEHQSEYSMVVKTPDLIKTKSKTESKTKTLVVVDDNTLARKNKFEQAINDYCQEPDKNSNAAYPEQPWLPEEKEKSSAKKEKEFPALELALSKVAETAHWRNTLEHHMIPTGVKWNKLNEAEKQVYYDERQALFKKFYEQKEDEYRILYPTFTAMAKNFYFWVNTCNRIELLKQKLPILHGDTVIKTPVNSKSFTKRTDSIRDELTQFRDQSRNFLRATGTNDGRVPFIE
jgi:hypothetical protein